jgi:hypothetical protein
MKVVMKDIKIYRVEREDGKMGIQMNSDDLMGRCSGVISLCGGSFEGGVVKFPFI